MKARLFPLDAHRVLQVVEVPEISVIPDLGDSRHFDWMAVS
ncbi:hypothetical protein SK803_15870 [Lentzea sp. BCCO 10_0856]|uniref:Uncharacterized protein n=1 Tax=Lentzea miocenica TaxID=3095431 RepID=A0ABU4T164_9PSEU|nr:hypothetical protein [Lentzea sp. BCCO 10_0856]MDX8031703.1 hypothetical protein [Lentzea sp. BCCO 10_0856]